MTMEDIARDAGYASEQELHRMVASVNLMAPGAFAAFKRWQADDGAKVGLMAAFPETVAAQDSPETLAADRRPL